jgi:hypothetical protein
MANRRSKLPQMNSGLPAGCLGEPNLFRLRVRHIAQQLGTPIHQTKKQIRTEGNASERPRMDDDVSTIRAAVGQKAKVVKQGEVSAGRLSWVRSNSRSYRRSVLARSWRTGSR